VVRTACESKGRHHQNRSEPRGQKCNVNRKHSGVEKQADRKNERAKEQLNRVVVVRVDAISQRVGLFATEQQKRAPQDASVQTVQRARVRAQALNVYREHDDSVLGRGRAKERAWRHRCHKHIAPQLW